MTAFATRLLFFACGLIVLFHVWGAIEPAQENWGVHLFAFYGPAAGLLASVLLAGLAFMLRQPRFLPALERFVRRLSRPPLVLLAAVSIGLLIALALGFPAKLHLLGDGAILLRSIHPGIGWGDDLVRSFRNQPFMRVMYQWAMDFHTAGGDPFQPYDVYVTIDIASAIVFVAFLFWFGKRLNRPPLDSVMLAGLLFLTAGTQFFFGYIENYVLLYITTAAYAVTGWMALERKVSVIVPIACLVAMIGFHLGCLIFLPSLLILIILRFRGDRVRLFSILAGIALAGAVFMYAIGFNPADFMLHIGWGSVDFLQPFTAIGGSFAYPMFSFMHALDWFNSSLLTAPAGLLVCVILVVMQFRDKGWKQPASMFLLTTTACGLLFTWIVNSGLGLARDWDLFASFFIPMVVLEVFLFNHYLPLKPVRYALLFCVAVTAIHCAAWIGINASEQRHLARMKMLDDTRMLSLVQQLAYDESLANFFFDHGDYRSARGYYKHFMTIDNTNPRIVGNIADVYRKLGEKDNYFAMLLRAVELKSRDPGVYSNLGVEYAGRGDTARAIEFNERALAVDSNQRLAHANLGILYTNIRQYPVAERHFTRAIELGMQEPIIFRYAGDVCLIQNEYERSLGYYDRYLQLAPADKRVRATRDRVSETVAILHKQQQK